MNPNRRRIPGTYNIFISDTCDLTYPDGERCNFPIKSNKVDIKLSGRIYNLDLKFLMLYSWFNMPTFINIDDIYFIPLYISRKLFPWRAMLKKPYYFDKRRKLRLVPSFSTVAISRNGECYNTVTSRYMEHHIGKTGYVFVNVLDPLVQKWRNVQLHTLVASAWIYKNQDSANFVVNHINGDKLNNNISNLEWTTIGYNSRDGILRKKALMEGYVAKVRNIKTGEVTKFKTLTELSSFVGLDSRIISSQVKNKPPSYLIKDRYEIRLDNDERPWYYTKDAIAGRSVPKYLITVKEPDGHEITFEGIKPFFDYYHVTSRGKCGIDERIKIFERKFPGYSVSYVNLRANKTIEVLQEDCVVKEFNTRKEVTLFYNIQFPTVNSLITSEGRNKRKGLRMRIKSDEPWPEEVKDTSRFIKVIVKDKFTGKEDIYPTYKAVAYALNMSRRIVSRHVTNPSPNDKYLISVETEQ